MEKIFVLTMASVYTEGDFSKDHFRAVGWFSTKDMAEKCIKENWADVWEAGTYNCAIIEEQGPGPHANTIGKMSWYSGKLIDEENHEYEVNEIEVPKGYEQVCNFGLG